MNIQSGGDRPDLTSRRVVVVGASSGIGAAVGRAAAAAGASVALMARRPDLLHEVAAHCVGRAMVLECDVRIPEAVENMVGGAAAHLGGIDAVVYATGVNHLAWLADTDAGAWRRLFETNVVGAALVARAALPHLRASTLTPRLAFLSSHSVARPWPGLGAYAATKAALDAMVGAWRDEDPDVVFARIVVGPTVTGMADGWDHETSREFFDKWATAGLLTEHVPVTPEVRAAALLEWLADPTPKTEIELV